MTSKEKRIKRFPISSRIVNKKKVKKVLKGIWYFIWEDNSFWSWIVNIILAFVLIKFIVYPGLGFLLGTGFPIVAVISGSMDHSLSGNNICGNFNSKDLFSFFNILFL